MEKTAPHIGVFIVDDSVILQRRLVELMLDIEGIEITGIAEEIQEALLAIRGMEPGVLILDIRLADGNGLTLLEAVKRDRPGWTVILLTNHAESAYRRQGEALGADFFFDKSTEFEKVRTVLIRLVQERKVRGDNVPA